MFKVGCSLDILDGLSVGKKANYRLGLAVFSKDVWEWGGGSSEMCESC